MTAFNCSRSQKFSDLDLDGLVGVRAAVESGLGWSCVPEILVSSSLKERKVMKLNLPILLQGELCLWWLRARRDCTRDSKKIHEWLASIV
jgi:DNA-binding transcriptional LysR family regulator